MTAPLVSVVIPFLDPPAGFLREAVNSVLAQDYRPLELILVSDGSAEATLDTARDLLNEADVTARLIAHPNGENRGLSASRNLGAAAADGEFLSFLDSDDVWMPGKISAQVDYLTRNPEAGMVFGLTKYWHSWCGSPATASKDYIVRRGVTRPVVMPPPEFVVRVLRGDIIVPGPSNAMIRMSAYHGCGGFEENFRDMYEDQVFFTKLGLMQYVAGLPECWDRYRQHPDSMTAKADRLGTEMDARRKFLRWILRYQATKNCDDPQIREAVRKELWLLAEPPAGVPKGVRAVLRWSKKWLLRVEESVVPARARRKFWAR